MRLNLKINISRPGFFKFSIWFFSCWVCLQSSVFSQEIETAGSQDSTIVVPTNGTPYFLYDLMIVGGLNRSGLFFSNEFRNLEYANGFQIGLEGFLPLGRVTFFDYGIQYAQRNFIHSTEQITFRNHYLDFPAYVSYALPEMKAIDWRFFLGVQLSYRLSSDQSGPYQNAGGFQYDPNGFRRMDGGMIFGLSGEWRNYYGRLRSYVGVNNMDTQDQGAMNSFFIEFGYFIFRGLK